MNPPVALDLDALCTAIDAGALPTWRFFWGHRSSGTGRLTESCLSQWWPCDFVVGAQRYTSAEQFMMAGKARLFGDATTLAEIVALDDPGRVKALGRRVRGFDEARWEDTREALVLAGSLAKFGQDGALRKYLISTGDDVLVEASPTDTIWGIGLARDDARARDPRAWNGLNLLGFALMHARAVLRGERAEPPRPACAG